MTVETVKGLLADKIDSAVFLSEFPTGYASSLVKEIFVSVSCETETETASGDNETRIAITIYMPLGTEPERAAELFSEICTVLKENLATLSSVSRESIRNDAKLRAVVVPCHAVFTGDSGCHFNIDGKSYDAVSMGVKEEITMRDFLAADEDEAVATVPGRVGYTGEIRGAELKGIDIARHFDIEIGDNRYLDCRFTSVCHGPSGLVSKACFRSERRMSI